MHMEDFQMPKSTADGAASDISGCRIFRAEDYYFPLGKKTYVMGILNVTPDSFSDGGRFNSVERALAHAKEMADAGADIIDVGGESTRPGHSPVDVKQEMERVVPVIRALRNELRVPLSVDTWKAAVAAAAVEAGASIINDVWGCRRDPDVAGVAARTGAGLILMFNASDDNLLQRSGNIAADAVSYLSESIRIARLAGVAEDRLMTDPGIGFGTDTEESLALVRAIPEIRDLGYPVLLGPSRKRFIGNVLGLPVEERLIGTVAVCCVGACLGADVVRVHDVRETVQAMRMRDAVMAARCAQEE